MTENWNANTYTENADFVPTFGETLISNLLDPKPGELILDLGCGDGILTKKIEESNCQVIGIDSSQNMVNACIEKGIEAYCMSGESFSFDRKFDAVFSNAALHWMKKSTSVIQNVYEILKDGGRFVGEFGAHGNINEVRSAIYSVLNDMGINPDALDPWYFPSDIEYKEALESCGFSVDFINKYDRPTPLKCDIKDWLAIFAYTFCVGMDEEEKDNFMSEVTSILSPSLKNKDDIWVLDYVRLQFVAVKR